jgi:hypothetical protein
LWHFLIFITGHLSLSLVASLLGCATLALPEVLLALHTDYPLLSVLGLVPGSQLCLLGLWKLLALQQLGFKGSWATSIA